ncbi:BRCT domain-containing protein [Paenibacillus sp. 32352]|uniref:BRCT domain-containing protein n=1 Tax=Paenibacillus sp. 32352 TaxID=1969111 RepID=UPI0009AE2FE3|nr:BRCT domain-containing protein [Paenibacillus sp. 32352]
MERNYKKYMGKAEFEKSLNTLKGLIQGMQADSSLNKQEIEELQHWCLLQTDHINKFPFNELIPMVKEAVSDGFLTDEEVEDINWLCNAYLNENPYFDVVSSDIQVLHGMLHGILSDNQITLEELNQLRDWLNDNSHLESVYPYDEVYSLLHNVLKDGKIDNEEEMLLKAFFADFIDTTTSYNINHGDLLELKKQMNIQGICALGPNIEITDKKFCFTGTSGKMKRSEIAKIITDNGGKYHDNVLKDTNYLIVGDEGNSCWAFSCYGRKIEKAINLRKEGKQIIIVHEVDFWDAVGN